jgi:hypothetical protein
MPPSSERSSHVGLVEMAFFILILQVLMALSWLSSQAKREAFSRVRSIDRLCEQPAFLRSSMRHLELPAIERQWLILKARLSVAMSSPL